MRKRSKQGSKLAFFSFNSTGKVQLEQFIDSLQLSPQGFYDIGASNRLAGIMIQEHWQLQGLPLQIFRERLARRGLDSLAASSGDGTIRSSGQELLKQFVAISWAVANSNMTRARSHK